jgi:hypothetical protein
MRRPITAALAALSFALAAPACVTDPVDGRRLSSRDQVITIQGLYNAPSKTLTVEAFDFVANGWRTVGSATSATTPLVAANTFGNNPDLFLYTTSVQAGKTPEEFDARWLPATGYAKLRVREGNFVPYASEAQGPNGELRGVGCVIEEADPGDDFFSTAFDCGFDDTEIDLSVNIVR